MNKKEGKKNHEKGMKRKQLRDIKRGWKILRENQKEGQGRKNQEDQWIQVWQWLQRNKARESAKIFGGSEEKKRYKINN